MRARVTVALLVVLGGRPAAQPDLQTTLLGMYTQTLGGMQKANWPARENLSRQDSCLDGKSVVFPPARP